MASSLVETGNDHHPVEISRAGLVATAVILLLMISALLLCLSRAFRPSLWQSMVLTIMLQNGESNPPQIGHGQKSRRQHGASMPPGN